MVSINIRIMPDTSTNLTKEILDFLTILLPYGSAVVIFWKMIDAVLKYANDGRDARTKELISQATAPLENDLKELTKSIWHLSEKIEKM